jgi:flagellar basal body P-ring formation protein FlgA
MAIVRGLALFAAFYILIGVAQAFADPVTLRPRIEANGPAVTMGDVFAGTPANVAGRAIAPAPPAGQISSISMAVLSASASAAGLEFTPPAGVAEVRVVRPGGMRATLPPSSSGHMVADAAVRRGETVTLVYAAPGMSLLMRARAMEDGAVGQTITFTNTSSNRTIDAVVTGPGRASANP